MHRLNVPRVSSNEYGLKSLFFRGGQIANLLSNEFKVVSSVSTFKEKIKRVGMGQAVNV